MKVEVIETGFQESLDTHITVIQAIPKGDRLKESIELITESGADRIIIWSAHRSIGKSDKGIEKLVRTAREASKQSRRYRIPEICGAMSSKNIIDEIGKSDLAIVFHESALSKLSDIVNTPAKKILVIIGPEGGITDAELELFAGAGAKVALLGRPILRSAHAGLAAVSAVNALLKVW